MSTLGSSVAGAAVVEAAGVAGLACAAGAAGFFTMCGFAGCAGGFGASAGVVAGGWATGGVGEICAVAPVESSSPAARIDIACGVFMVGRNHPCAALAALEALA